MPTKRGNFCLNHLYFTVFTVEMIKNVTNLKGEKAKMGCLSSDSVVILKIIIAIIILIIIISRDRAGLVQNGWR